jgi:hypothetical protein
MAKMLRTTTEAADRVGVSPQKFVAVARRLNQYPWNSFEPRSTRRLWTGRSVIDVARHIRGKK